MSLAPPLSEWRRRVVLLSRQTSRWSCGRALPVVPHSVFRSRGIGEWARNQGRSQALMAAHRPRPPGWPLGSLPKSTIAPGLGAEGIDQLDQIASGDAASDRTAATSLLLSKMATGSAIGQRDVAHLEHRNHTNIGLSNHKVSNRTSRSLARMHTRERAARQFFSFLSRRPWARGVARLRSRWP
jgi:hypothetical protein